MKFIDLFAGVGGFRLGMENAGHECVWSCEWDKFARMTYEKNFGKLPEGCDIREVDTSSIPDHEVICGGFPCQSFSIAGKRGGFVDTRGMLFFEIMRIAKDKGTPYLFLENVKGLLSHDDGRTFGTILSTLDECGYDVEWQVCNSKFFGVPQNRERVFIIANLRGKPRSKIFPLTKSGTGDIGSQGEAQGEGKQLRSDNPQCASVDTRTGSTARGQHLIAGSLRVGGGDTKDLIANTLAKRDYKGGNNLIQLNNPSHNRNIVYCPDGVSPALRTTLKGPRIAQRTPLKFLDRNQKNIEGDYSFTVDTSNTGGVQVGSDIRRLTPLECERLQGFPDNWTSGVSSTQRYKQMGNAVTVNVIQHIATLLKGNE